MPDLATYRHGWSSAPSTPMGKYLPFARLGVGGMADVLLTVAHGPLGFKKLAVVKLLRDHEDNEIVRMFLDEARLSARLRHPNVVDTYEVGGDGGRFFIAMEYLEGVSLDVLLIALAGRGESVEPRLAVYIVAQALKGLHYAHELRDYDGKPIGLVHRDVSPHNVFVTYDGEVKLVDFGVAKATVNLTHTDIGTLKGKFRYMSPEQAISADVDRRSDIFAMGLVLWELVAQRRVFEGDAMTVLRKIIEEDAPALRTVVPEAPPAIEAILRRALARERDARFPSADAMRLELEAYLRDVGAKDTDAELAALLAELFAEKRDAVRARVEVELARGDGSDPRASDGLIPLSLAPRTSDADSSGATRGTVTEAEPTTPTTVHGARPRSIRQWAMAAALVASLTALGATVARGPAVPAVSAIPPALTVAATWATDDARPPQAAPVLAAPTAGTDGPAASATTAQRPPKARPLAPKTIPSGASTVAPRGSTEPSPKPTATSTPSPRIRVLDETLEGK